MRAGRAGHWLFLRGKGLAAVLTSILLLQGGLVVYLLWNETLHAEGERRVRQAQEGVTAAESAVRRLLREGEQIFIDPAEKSLPLRDRPEGEAAAALGDLAQEIGRAPKLAALASALDSLATTARAMEAWLDRVDQLARDGRSDEAKMLTGTEGERLEQILVERLEQSVAVGRQLAEEESRRLREIRRSRRGLLLSVGGLTLLIGLLEAYRSWRLARVAEEVQELAAASSPSPPLPAGRMGSLDQTLRRSAFQMSETLRQREAALQEAAEELAEANRELLLRTQEMEAFIRGVSHDLRSPLVNIQGFSREIQLSCQDLEVLLSTIELQAPEQARLGHIQREIREAVYYMDSAVASTSRIIAALQKLARAGHRHYEWQELDIRAMVSAILDSMHAMRSARGAEVTLGDLPSAWGDAMAVEQIFANLLKNAISYLDPGRPGRIEVGARPGSPGTSIVTYWVRDNGIGIAARHLGEIFTAFRRIHADVAEGEGIGLALVHRSVKRLGGNIRVESTEGAGTTFFFTLRTDGRRQDTPLPFQSE